LVLRRLTVDPSSGLSQGILQSYAKRVDLWNVYLDQEVKLGDLPRARALFERATALTLPARRMKSLFKKYLEFEAEHGDEEHEEHVKAKAMEFAEANL